MPRKTSLIIELTSTERTELETWIRSTTQKAGLSKRARIILLRDKDVPVTHIADQVGMRRRHVEKWLKRFRTQRIEGLYDAPRSGRPPRFSPRGGRTCSQDRLRAA